MKTIDLSETLRPYEKEWVALEKETHAVLAHGKTLKEVKESAQKAGAANPLFTFVPPFDAVFAP